MIADPSLAPRVDARAKVTGQARYVEDLPDLPGTAYAVSLRSPYSHARILSIDASAAEALPGVYAVIHGRNLADFGLGSYQQPKYEQEFLTSDKVRFDGDLIAMVAAADLATAKQAAELVKIEYELLEPVFTFQEALSADAPLVHEQLGHNLALEDDLAWGDVDAALAKADHVVETTFHAGSVYHHPIEPATSMVVSFVGDTFECWMPTNHPYDVVERASKLYDVPEDQVRVRVPAVGGSFGSKDIRWSPEPLPLAALSRKIGRPVKLLASEEDGFRTISRHAITYHARIGVDASGIISALDVVLDIDTGAYFTGARTVTSNAVTSVMGAYRIPNFRCRAKTVYTNKIPSATFRNTGKNQTTFGIECAIDVAANELGLDPIEFRLKNVLRRGDHLAPEEWFRKQTLGDVPPPPIDTDIPELLAAALEAVPLEQSPPTRGRVRGRGVAISVRRSSESGVAEALATLDADNGVTITHNAPDVGEGSHTMIRSVAAMALGIAPESIRVSEPDTGIKLMFTGTSSQRTTIQMGSAVQNACQDLKAKMVSEGRKPGLTGRGDYSRYSVGDRSFGGNYHWTPGAAVAEVEVDTDTGQVRLLRYATASDSGKTLHLASARGQLEGGAVMGLGLALFEELRYEDGRLQNADPIQYRLPLARDVPQQFGVTLVEHGDGPGPFGSKAIAQTSIPCMAPAIANAIHDATGARLTSTPFTPEKVLRALGKL